MGWECRSGCRHSDRLAQGAQLRIRTMKPTTPPAGVSVTFWGAARTVTGSMHLVEAGGNRLLLDCGLFQGPRDESPRAQQHASRSTREHRRRRPQPRPHRPLRQPAQPRPAGLRRADLLHAGDARPAGRHARRLGQDPGGRRRLPQPQARRGEPKVEPLYDAADVYRTLRRRCRRSATARASTIGSGMDAPRSSTPATCSARRWCICDRRGTTASGELDLHRRPRPARPADPARPGAGAAGATCSSARAPTAAASHEPVDETGGRLGEVVRRTVGARRQGARSPRSPSAARRRSSTSCTS